MSRVHAVQLSGRPAPVSGAFIGPLAACSLRTTAAGCCLARSLGPLDIACATSIALSLEEKTERYKEKKKKKANLLGKLPASLETRAVIVVRVKATRQSRLARVASRVETLVGPVVYKPGTLPLLPRYNVTSRSPTLFANFLSFVFLTLTIRQPTDRESPSIAGRAGVSRSCRKSRRLPFMPVPLKH